MDEWAIYGHNLPFQQEIWQGDKLFSRMMVRIYEPEDYEGFRAMFGEDEPVIIETESEEPF